MKNVLQKFAHEPAADPTIVFKSNSLLPVAPAAIPLVKYLNRIAIDTLEDNAVKYPPKRSLFVYWQELFLFAKFRPAL
jgi:hypothetical protein